MMAMIGKQALRNMAVIAFAATTSVAHADDPRQQPVTIAHLAECQQVTDGTARLACFDQRAAELLTAVNDRSVVVAEREEIQASNRSLFGLRLPRIRIFSGDNDEEEIAEIETVVQSISHRGDGTIGFTVEDGARWVQTDSRVVTGAVRQGTHVTIRRGALGSFFAAFQGAISVRVQRVN